MRTATLAQLIDKGVALWPDDPAVVTGEVSYRYRRLDREATALARGLRTAGIGRGDRVALLTGNDPLTAVALLGIARANAVTVLLNARASLDSLAFVLEDSGASALLVADDYTDLGKRLVDAGAAPPIVAGAVGRRLEELTAAADPATTLTPPGPDDLALLVYTSGSTGRPKGVPLLHRGIVANIDAVRRALMVADDDRALIFAPLFHVNALVCGLLPFLMEGAVTILLPRFDARAAIEAIQRHRATYMTGVPTMYALMLRETDLLRRCDLSSLRYCLCGSATVTPQLADAIESTFGVTMLEGYGLTEGGPVVACSPRWGIRKRGSTGLPLPGIEVRLVDPDSREPRSDQGELEVRGPGNTPGYWNLPEVTAQRFTDDGWLRTGDLVRRDEQGYLSILGRVDDMFICAGENIYPKEVEDVLLQCPGVAEAAVVPLADELKGDVPVAFVVADDPGLTPEAVVEAYLARGAAYSHPRHVAIVESLPAGATGKLDRASLVAAAAERWGGAQT